MNKKITKLLLIIVTFSGLLYSCEEKGNIKITGSIEGGEERTIYLDKLEVAGPAIFDSTTIKGNNNFSFNANISYPTFFHLRLDNGNFITLLAEPGETITVDAETNTFSSKYQIEGSEGSELVKKLNDRLLETRRQIQPLIREIAAIEDHSGSEDELLRIEEEINEILKLQRYFSVSFILENMESMAAITALYQQVGDNHYVLNQTRDIQYMKIVAESLIERYPESPHVRALKADAEDQERRYEVFRLIHMAEESGQVHEALYPEIEMPGPDGDTISLHSLPQKYVLVFFGSSLNPASVELSTDLIPVYNRFHNRGFEIYQVSVERDREEWISSLQFLELPWIHVAQLDEEENFIAAQLYNVQEIPSNFLINRDAGVVARNLTPGELNRRLSRIMD